MKKCTTCNNVTNNFIGNFVTCNKCLEYKRQYRLAHKEEIRQQQKKYRLENSEKRNKCLKRSKLKVKIEVFNAYGGCVCKCCRETELSFLSIDHVNNDGYIHRKEVSGGNQFYYWLKRNNYPTPERFQVLCMNCQIGKRLNNGICPHIPKRQEVARRCVTRLGP